MSDSCCSAVVLHLLVIKYSTNILWAINTNLHFLFIAEFRVCFTAAQSQVVLPNSRFCSLPQAKEILFPRA